MATGGQHGDSIRVQRTDPPSVGLGSHTFGTHERADGRTKLRKMACGTKFDSRDGRARENPIQFGSWSARSSTACAWLPPTDRPTDWRLIEFRWRRAAAPKQTVAGTKLASEQVTRSSNQPTSWWQPARVSLADLSQRFSHHSSARSSLFFQSSSLFVCLVICFALTTRKVVAA